MGKTGREGTNAMATAAAEAEKIADWFEKRLNGTFLILKEEGNDADRVRITVRKTKFWPGMKAADDYVEESRIILIGEGRIDGDGDRHTAAAPLPRESYEIPLGDEFRWEALGDSLKISTARATYIVSPLTAN